MKVIDGKGAIMGRVASFAAKEALKGEEIVIVNCDEMLISGNKEFTESKFRERRKRVGFTQTGPKISRSPHLIVKRTIRGMVPNHRKGRGKEALKRVMCFVGIPKQYEKTEKLEIAKGLRVKHIKVKDIAK